MYHGQRHVQAAFTIANTTTISRTARRQGTVMQRASSSERPTAFPKSSTPNILFHLALFWMMLASRSYHWPKGCDPGTMQW